jgi:hypothetical protein
MGSSDCLRAWFLGLLAVVALAGRDAGGGDSAGGQAEKKQSRGVGEQVDAVIKDLKNE